MSETRKRTRRQIALPVAEGPPSMSTSTAKAFCGHMVNFTSNADKQQRIEGLCDVEHLQRHKTDENNAAATAAFQWASSDLAEAPTPLPTLTLKTHKIDGSSIETLTSTGGFPLQTSSPAPAPSINTSVNAKALRSRGKARGNDMRVAVTDEDNLTSMVGFVPEMPSDPSAVKEIASSSHTHQAHIRFPTATNEEFPGALFAEISVNRSVFYPFKTTDISNFNVIDLLRAVKKHDFFGVMFPSTANHVHPHVWMLKSTTRVVPSRVDESNAVELTGRASIADLVHEFKLAILEHKTGCYVQIVIYDPSSVPVSSPAIAPAVESHEILAKDSVFDNFKSLRELTEKDPIPLDEEIWQGILKSDARALKPRSFNPLEGVAFNQQSSACYANTNPDMQWTSDLSVYKWKPRIVTLTKHTLPVLNSRLLFVRGWYDAFFEDPYYLDNLNAKPNVEEGVDAYDSIKYPHPSEQTYTAKSNAFFRLQRPLIARSRGREKMFVIKGPPGIGKSSAGLWFFCRAVRAKKNVFYRYHEMGTFYIAYINGHFSWGFSEDEPREQRLVEGDKGGLLILDGIEYTNYPRCYVVGIASARASEKSIFSEILKECVKIYAPVFSYVELEALAIVTNQKVNTDLYSKIGGVPRALFPGDGRIVQLRDTIGSMSLEVVRKLLRREQSGFGNDSYTSEATNKGEVSFHLVHYWVSPDLRAGRRLIASDYITQLLIKRCQDLVADKVVEFRNLMGDASGERSEFGIFFERSVQQMIADGGSFPSRMFTVNSPAGTTIHNLIVQRAAEQKKKPKGPIELTVKWDCTQTVVVLQKSTTGRFEDVDTVTIDGKHRWHVLKHNFPAIDCIEADGTFSNMACGQQHNLMVLGAGGSGLAVFAQQLYGRDIARWPEHINFYFILPEEFIDDFLPGQVISRHDDVYAQAVCERLRVYAVGVPFFTSLTIDAIADASA